MQSLNDELKSFLNQLGCSIIGFADLRSLSKESRQNFDYGILIALSYSKEAMRDNKNGLPQKYYAELEAINKHLPQLALLTSDFLVSKGYKALAKTSSTVVQDENH